MGLNIKTVFEHQNSAVIKTSTNVTKILSMQPESR